MLFVMASLITTCLPYHVLFSLVVLTPKPKVERRIVFKLFGDNGNNVLVRHDMTQPDPLRYMSSASSPYHSILKCLLQRPVNLIADFFDRRFVSHNQCLAKIWLFPFPVDALAG